MYFAFIYYYRILDTVFVIYIVIQDFEIFRLVGMTIITILESGFQNHVEYPLDGSFWIYVEYFLDGNYIEYAPKGSLRNQPCRLPSEWILLEPCRLFSERILLEPCRLFSEWILLKRHYNNIWFMFMTILILCLFFILYSKLQRNDK